MKEKIYIEINDKGEVLAETIDMYGNSCIEELDKLLKNLMLEHETEKKDEFFKNKTKTTNHLKVENLK
ncbi:hypothetical protein RI065_06450 [Mycoplasmatota bacterium zrk1]